MKNYMIRNDRKRPTGRITFALVALALLGIAVAPAPAADSSVIKPPSIQTRPYGKTYGEWSAKWWQWSMAFPVTADPASDTAPTSSRQSGNVWFLAGAHGSATGGGSATVTRRLRVPQGKALFFPIVTVVTDNVGCPYPNDPFLTAQQLAAEGSALWDGAPVSETSCTIDGVSVPGLDDPIHTAYWVQSPAFSYTVAQHDNLLAAVFDYPCIPDGTTVNPAVSTGVFLMVAPLSVGHHTIHYRGVVGSLDDPFFFKDITYRIRVVAVTGDDDDDDRDDDDERDH